MEFVCKTFHQIGYKYPLLQPTNGLPCLTNLFFSSSSLEFNEDKNHIQKLDRNINEARKQQRWLISHPINRHGNHRFVLCWISIFFQRLDDWNRSTKWKWKRTFLNVALTWLLAAAVVAVAVVAAALIVVVVVVFYRFVCRSVCCMVWVLCACCRLLLSSLLLCFLFFFWVDDCWARNPFIIHGAINVHINNSNNNLPTFSLRFVDLYVV